MRDGATFDPAKDSGESYDLVVGAGISGLSSAYFYRKAYGVRGSWYSTITMTSAVMQSATSFVLETIR